MYQGVNIYIINIGTLCVVANIMNSIQFLLIAKIVDDNSNKCDNCLIPHFFSLLIFKRATCSQVWWHIPVFQAPGRLIQEDCMFELHRETLPH